MKSYYISIDKILYILRLIYAIIKFEFLFVFIVMILILFIIIYIIFLLYKIIIKN